MKNLTILPIVFCLLILGITKGCKSKFDEKKYLMQILNNLEQVKSASYVSSVSSSGAMGEIAHIRYVKEFFNPADTAIGSIHGHFDLTDTTKMEYYYDGNAKVSITDNSKTISIDSFKVYRMPARIITPPFFNYTKSIIKYALTSNDSLLKEFHDFGDSLLFSLTIYSDKQVEFFGRPIYLKNPYGPDEEISKYDIWINKTTGLPYKFRRTMSHNISEEKYSDLQINKMDIKDFIPVRYFPADYDIYIRGHQTIKVTSPEENLIGKKAPDWTLSDSNNELFSLKDFKSKVLVMQFSGIGCPPCHASLPFLNQLVTDYKDKSFELVRIECWNNNYIDIIKRYCLNNNITYKFLLKDNEIEKNYNILAVPTFFILDNNRIIQDVVRGYAPGGESEKKIKEAIERLL